MNEPIDVNGPDFFIAVVKWVAVVVAVCSVGALFIVVNFDKPNVDLSKCGKFVEAHDAQLGKIRNIYLCGQEDIEEPYLVIE